MPCFSQNLQQNTCIHTLCNITTPACLALVVTDQYCLLQHLFTRRSKNLNSWFMTSYGFLTEGKSLSCSETGYLEAVFAGSFPPAAGKQKSTGLSLARVRLSFPKSNNSSAAVLSACVQSAMSVCSAMYPFIAMQTYLTAQRLSSVQSKTS